MSTPAFAQPVVAIATKEDLAEVLALNETAVDGTRWPQDAWRVYLPDDDAGNGGERSAAILTMKQGEGQLAGWLAGTVVGDSAEVDFVLVAARYRGRGVGRQLLRAWFTWARERGATKVLLEVRASNATAIRLYEALEFRVQGRRKAYYRGPVEDAVLMHLELDGAPARQLQQGW